MTDWLDTIVQKCEARANSTKLILNTRETEGIRYNVPICINLTPGDRIEFFQGSVQCKETPCITHDDYQIAEFYRKRGGQRKESIMVLYARDMRLLAQLRRDYDPKPSSAVGPSQP